jgi:hypothetical protein
VSAVTGEAHPVFAMLTGVQRMNRKLTLLVLSAAKQVLGYMKLPLTASSEERVRHEAEILQRLWTFAPMQEHIPRLLFAGDYNGSFVLFQGPLTGAAGPARFGAPHRSFLTTLAKIHTSEQPGEQLLAEVAQRWSRRSTSSSQVWQDLGSVVVRRSMELLRGFRVPLTVMHGDFAPWNTRLQKEHLQVFDWESAVWNAPQLWDEFHFQVQIECFLHRRTGLLRRYREPAQRAILMLYLLSSACDLMAQEADPTGIRFRQLLLARCLTDASLKGHVRQQTATVQVPL